MRRSFLLVCPSPWAGGRGHALLGVVEHALHVLVQDTLGDCAYHGIDHLLLVEEQQGRDTTDAIALCHPRMLIDIALANLQLSGILRGHLFDYGSDQATRTTPRGPEVHQDWTRGLQYFLGKIARSEC